MHLLVYFLFLICSFVQTFTHNVCFVICCIYLEHNILLNTHNSKLYALLQLWCTIVIVFTISYDSNYK